MSFAGYLGSAIVPVAPGLLAAWAWIAWRQRGAWQSSAAAVLETERRTDGTALDRWRCEQVAVPAGHPHEAGDEHACAVQQLLVGGVFDGDFHPTSGGVAQRGKAGLGGAAGIGGGVEHLLLQKRRLAPQVEIGAILAGVRADVDVSVDQPWQKRLAADVVDARTVRNADARTRSDGQDLAPAEQHAAIFERRRAVAIDQRASDQGDVLRHGSSRCYSVFGQ